MKKIKVCAVISRYVEEDFVISDEDFNSIEEAEKELLDVIYLDYSPFNEEILEITYSVIEDANNG